jgi:Fe/S biogenesis protein NfuA
MNDTLEATILTVTDAARATVLEARADEIDATSLALWLEVNGTDKFTYEMYFQPLDEARDADTRIDAGEGLSVVVPAASIDKVRGSTLDLASDGSGMVLSNPNEPKRPEPVAPTGTLDGPVAARVLEVLEQQVNPSIAAHGGFATLISVDGDTVFLTMGGGCQGCAMSKATLRQGIEVAIKDAVPEIHNVVDVTDHEVGANPYF